MSHSARRRPGKQELILAYVREKGECSRGDIAREFSLDKKAVSVAVEALLSEGLLGVSGYGESRAGRRRELLSLNGGHAAAIGIDLGATHVIGVLTDFAGTVLHRASYEVRPGLPADIILDQMKTIAAGLRASWKSARAGGTPGSPADGGVRAIGVCVPGFVHPREGVSLVAENIPGWKGVRIREIFEAELGVPAFVQDSSRAFAMAERWLGHGRGQRDFIAVDLGYGIGMGIFAAGALYTGTGWKSGEIGHVVVDPQGLPCACGNRGCLETVASGRAIARQAAEGIRDGRSPLLRDLTKGSPEAVTAQDVAVAANMQDPYAAGLLREAGRAVGLAIANAAALLNPSVVVLGGGLVSAGRVLLDSVAEAAARSAMPGIREDMQLRVSQLGIDASARGMALIAAAAL